MIQNIVIGKPLVPAETLIASSQEDWENNESKVTLFTNNRFLPAIMKEANIVTSTSEVRRNNPALVTTFDPDKTDCLWLKWGKKIIFLVIEKEK